MSEPRAADRATARWLLVLGAVAVLNIAAWAWIALHVERTPYVSAQLALSAIFTGVCAFRSFLPRLDLERLCIWDTPLSSIFLGRSAATIAEVSFGLQSRLLLIELAGIAQLPQLTFVAEYLVPLAVVSQLACWHSVLTLDHRGHAVEEALWTVFVVLVGVSLAFACFHVGELLRLVLTLGVVASAGAAALTALIDVPMYIGRWKRSVAEGSKVLTLAEGVRDSIVRRHPTRAWSDWREETPWKTLYFSAGVWISLSMVHLQRMAEAD